MMRWVPAGVAALVVLSGVGPAAADPGREIYHYYDAEGRLHVTNIPSSPGVELVIPAPERPPATTPGALRGFPYAGIVAATAERYRLPAELILAVMETESNFNPWAVSRAGARGLMQLMPGTAALMGVPRGRIHDPHENIEGGARYLRMMWDRFGRLDLALAAYNAGPEAVERYGRQIPPFRETLAYVPRVMRLYRRNTNGRPPAISSAAVAAREAAPAEEAPAETSRPIHWYRDAGGQIHVSNMPR
jgi:soluble lytic murein transglycosylase-like protein